MNPIQRLILSSILGLLLLPLDSFSQFNHIWSFPLERHRDSSNVINTASFFQHMETDTQGNIYVAGGVIDTVDFDGGPGVYQVVSAGVQQTSAIFGKYDSTGALLWMHDFVVQDTFNAGVGLEIDDQGNLYYMIISRALVDLDPGAGTFYVTPVSGQPALAIGKYDPSGNFISGMTLPPAAPGGISVTNPKMDRAENGDILIAASFTGTIDLDPGPGTVSATGGQASIFVARYDSAFNYQGSFTLSAPNQLFMLDMSAAAGNRFFLALRGNDPIDVDPGQAILTVNNAPFPADADAMILQYDQAFTPTGVVQIKNGSAQFKRLADGGVAVIGWFNSISDFDPSTNSSPISPGSFGASFIATYDANFSLNWAHAFRNSTTRYLWFYDVLGSLDQRVVLGYHLDGTMDIDPGPGTTMQTGAGNFSLMQFDSMGNFRGYSDFGIASTSYANRLSTGPANTILLSGKTSTPFDHDPGPGMQLYDPGNHSPDGFLIRLGVESLPVSGTEPLRDLPNLELFPVPVSDVLQVQAYQGLWGPVQISVRDLQGKLVYFQIQPQPLWPQALNLAKLPSGMYLLTLEQAGVRRSKRFVKQ